MTEHLMIQRMHHFVSLAVSLPPYPIERFLMALIVCAAFIVVYHARGICREVCGHHPLAITLGAALRPLLLFSPLPAASLLRRLGKLGRGLVELLAFGSHGCTLHANA